MLILIYRQRRFVESIYCCYKFCTRLYTISVDHKLFSKGRSLANFVVNDTFHQLLFKQVGRTLIRIAYKQVATEFLTISRWEDKYLQQLHIFCQHLPKNKGILLAFWPLLSRPISPIKPAV